jgi:hypothetical protein
MHRVGAFQLYEAQLLNNYLGSHMRDGPNKVASIIVSIVKQSTWSKHFEIQVACHILYPFRDFGFPDHRI